MTHPRDAVSLAQRVVLRIELDNSGKALIVKVQQGVDIQRIGAAVSSWLLSGAWIGLILWALLYIPAVCDLEEFTEIL